MEISKTLNCKNISLHVCQALTLENVDDKNTKGKEHKEVFQIFNFNDLT
jgi:hypothetical protein